jgi:tellurite resistance protein
VQQALSDKGFNPGRVDGQWGKKSINALRAFQKANGLAPSGVFDDAATDVLFPAAKAETPLAKPPVDILKPQVEVVKPVTSQKAEQKPAYVEPVDARKALEEAVKPVPKIQVLIEKMPPAAVEKKMTSRAADVEAVPQPLPTSTSSQSLLAFGACAAAAGLLALFVFRRSRKSVDRREPELTTPPAFGRDLTVSANLPLARGSDPIASAPQAPVFDRSHVNAPLAQTTAGDQEKSTNIAETPLPDVGTRAESDKRMPDFRVSLAAHNIEVVNFIAERARVAGQTTGDMVSAGDPVSTGLDMQGEAISEVRQADSVTTSAFRIATPQRSDEDAGRDSKQIDPTPKIEIQHGATAVPEPDFRVTLAAHNRDIAAFVAANAVRHAEQGIPAPTAAGQTSEPTAVEAGGAGSSSYDTTVPDGKPFFGTARRADGSGPLSLVGNARASAVPPRAANDCWVSRGSRVTVSGVSFEGGLIYLGSYLPKQGAAHESENCLIDPYLKVSMVGDPDGRTMGYWPSYARITPEARRSYLSWLAGPRSDPGAYIGYVFLYFYGLERRLMLDDGAHDGDEVCREVQRLLDVYGANNSFNRYARELLSAYELRSGPASDGRIPDIDSGGYEVPMPIKLALGARVRDGRPFEAELLMKFALTHPETRLRTPARRAPDLLRDLFAEELSIRHPQGLTIKAGRFKKLKSTYRACSGSFTMDVAALDGTIPDITDRAEPIGTARGILELCSDKLDEYSRALGRSPGLQPTLGIAAKLPSSVRSKIAASLPGNPLSVLADHAKEGRSISLGDLLTLTALEVGNTLGKSKLRELAHLLASFGYGVTADPIYAFKLAVREDPVLIFRISQSEPQNAEASPAYRAAQLSLMLGMMIGHADGSFDASERSALQKQIDVNSDITADERVRLRAEMAVHELNPAGLEEWSKRLKDVPASAKGALAAELVVVAAADGNVHSSEIKKLEALFKRMGLDPQSLYAMLHEAGSRRDEDDLPVLVAAGENPEAIPLPRPSKPSSSGIDLERLLKIRNETAATRDILGRIFADEEGPPEIIVAELEPIDDGGEFEGLERRYVLLVGELASRETWSAQDFGILARNAGLMPEAARQAINDWSIDKLGDLLLEDEDPITVSTYLLPQITSTSSSIPESVTT